MPFFNLRFKILFYSRRLFSEIYKLPTIIYGLLVWVTKNSFLNWESIFAHKKEHVTSLKVFHFVNWIAIKKSILFSIKYEKSAANNSICIHVQRSRPTLFTLWMKQVVSHELCTNVLYLNLGSIGKRQCLLRQLWNGMLCNAKEKRSVNGWNGVNVIQHLEMTEETKNEILNK